MAELILEVSKLTTRIKFGMFLKPKTKEDFDKEELIRVGEKIRSSLNTWKIRHKYGVYNKRGVFLEEKWLYEWVLSTPAETLIAVAALIGVKASEHNLEIKIEIQEEDENDGTK